MNFLLEWDFFQSNISKTRIKPQVKLSLVRVCFIVSI
ncbi:hypothetical protein CECT5772_02603 [Streptococcus equi subsp. ruminatorum CECT 5772]|uniref:Uncharacterized protein n=1 Tax=Streptococcus equi subsp. ruminatorum CECT 5772 TaxID=1051981 RepID=A0A922NVQ8_9STRE|nr:hypothetical protein CECT5772_02603 [Streptococcus equi subsp. ruminatorum CECT 5772]